MCFFFFKQKTAYEMRISDWSPDVCSSDLIEKAGLPHEVQRIDLVGEEVGQHGSDARGRGLLVVEAVVAVDHQPLGRRPGLRRRIEDRKRVGSGKSVSVREDLGGRSIIKNTKIIQNTEKHNTNRKGT